MAKDLERADLMRVSQLIEPAGVHDAERQEGARRLGREAAVAQLQTLRPVPQRHALTAQVTRVEQVKAAHSKANEVGAHCRSSGANGEFIARRGALSSVHSST
ncbi:hypothetical protein [Xanthomonas axonopodis]|uniref:hypothetical protein n=1 Tax=Xanthomonas axonopodis TaxID=53413 RepID=UPI0009D215AE|nr:hypothetical protein [Xanthomonas axonopodis]OOW87589.1 hypothetical protein Xvtw_07605 [Xanthomonas campestris pv. vitiswoodrowii]OOX19426.1 hypothetical protein Xbuh_08020 [Xanthomonas axonopodis pv. bauhiniae]